jgi:hypothetical protein
MPTDSLDQLDVPKSDVHSLGADSTQSTSPALGSTIIAIEDTSQDLSICRFRT